jgi:hypothetical protein
MKQFDLEEIKRFIAEKYNWGPSADWTNFHFKELSKAIEQVTGDRISEETLKRIFGKRKVNTENYQPQAFSQMALLKFIENQEEPVQTRQKPNPVQKRLYKMRVLIFAGAVALIVSIFIFIPFKKATDPNFRFSCENAADNYPYTATFHYDISEIRDSVFTDFGRNRETFLPPERTMINYFYSNTGIYNVRFYTRSRVLDSLKIIAFSNDWQGGYFPNAEPEKFQPFINQDIFKQPGFFYAPPDVLKNEGVDLTQRYWTTYRFFAPFNKSLDSLAMETRVLNNASTGSLLCYDVEITLIGDMGTINFKFTQLRCSRHANLRVSEKYLDGEFDDLSALSVDLSDWLQIAMTTQNGKLEIALADTVIFSETYQKPLGNLFGVVYSFFGSGEIDFLELKDAKGKIFYTTSFLKN